MCVLIAHALSPVAAPIGMQGDSHVTRIVAAVVFGSIAVTVSYALGLNHYFNLTSRSQLVVLIGLLAVITTAISTAVISIALFKQIGRYIVLLFGLFFFLVECLARLSWFNRIKMSFHRIGLIAPKDSPVIVQLDRLAKGATFRVEIVHELSDNGDVDQSFDRLIANGVDEIVISDSKALMHAKLLSYMKNGGTISTVDAFSERHFFKVPVSFLTPEWFYNLDLKQHHPLYYSGKRVLDVLVALAIGILSLPILMVAVVLISLESRGPIFYSQVRVGLYQKPFRIWKLRTMRVDSETDGPRWASAKDPRITFVGKILRKTRIDEIPQIWNILAGTMSFVGPRPERPEFVKMLCKEISYYEQRHLVKPGLTGWAQICYRYGSSVDDAKEKLAYDIYYIKNASLLLDLQIIVQTIGAIAKGAR